MDPLSVVGLMIAAVAVVGLALQFGRRGPAEGVPASVDVEPDVAAVEPVAGVWEQPPSCQHPGIAMIYVGGAAIAKCASCGDERVIAPRPEFTLRGQPPPDASWVTMEIVGPRPFRIPPSRPKYESIRK
jgi:hypothetical protein